MHFYSLQVFMEIPDDQPLGRLKNVPARVQKLMRRAGVRHLSDLSRFSRDELLEHHNVGSWTIEQAEMLLNERGLKLRSP